MKEMPIDAHTILADIQTMSCLRRRFKNPIAYRGRTSSSCVKRLSYHFPLDLDEAGEENIVLDVYMFEKSVHELSQFL